ncbi:hypothetical protein, partial [Aromatoleum aromaticum]|uniref:hypothetical protein n=1 Tax=Aromatoleum aromaticum TaxID=551760 RepID=UPI001B7CEED0
MDGIVVRAASVECRARERSGGRIVSCRQAARAAPAVKAPQSGVPMMTKALLRVLGALFLGGWLATAHPSH